MKLNGINETIQRALAAAGLNKRSSLVKGVAETINHALSAAGLSHRAPETPSPVTRSEAPVGEGRFLTKSYANDAGARDYKLYIPASYSQESMQRVPLLVMLHGCTQSPDDFAAGTRMNMLAEEHGFLVVYPAQVANANQARCWNWFRPEDQRRDLGEPSIIAGITREVSSTYRIDSRRVFIAGLSAGASMALILAETYPELYAAVGVHSGPPYWAAHDVSSAFAAMQGRGTRSQASRSVSVPTIIFHGDEDRTVNASNADAIVERVTSASGSTAMRANDQGGTARGGRRYRRTDYIDATNQAVLEHWVVHGAGHAWSGGSRDGSFTDPTGPDASAEMVRFFLSHARAQSS